MKMQQYLLLYKDGSLSYRDNWKERFDEIEHMLIKINGESNLFIDIIPTDYLLSMTSASITVESIIEEHTADELRYDCARKPFTQIKKKFSDPLEFILFLASICRLYYVNDIFNSSDNYTFYQIRFCFIKIDVFHNKNRIYHYKTSFSKEHVYFGVGDIASDIKKICKFSSIFDGDDILNIHTKSKRWKVSKNVFKECTVGIPMSGSKVIAFQNWADLKVISDHINGMYFDTVYIDELSGGQLLDHAEDLVNGQFGSPYILNYLAGDIRSIIEYITQLPYLYISQKAVFETFQYGKANDALKPVTYITIDCVSEDEEYSLDEVSMLSDIFTIDKLLLCLIGGDDDEDE